MLRKISAMIAAVAAVAMFSAVLHAQLANVTISQDDIDLYVKVIDAGADSAPLVQGVDPAHFAAANTKIGFFAALVGSGQDEATRKAALGANPAFSFTDEEIALLNQNADPLAAAYKKSLGMQ
jgi:hypothetical protein